MKIYHDLLVVVLVVVVVARSRRYPIREEYLSNFATTVNSFTGQGKPPLFLRK